MTIWENISAWWQGYSKIHTYKHDCGAVWIESEKPFFGYKKPTICPTCKQPLQIAPENVRLFEEKKTP